MRLLFASFFILSLSLSAQTTVRYTIDSVSYTSHTAALSHEARQHLFDSLKVLHGSYTPSFGCNRTVFQTLSFSLPLTKTIHGQQLIVLNMNQPNLQETEEIVIGLVNKHYTKTEYPNTYPYTPNSSWGTLSIESSFDSKSQTLTKRLDLGDEITEKHYQLLNSKTLYITFESNKRKSIECLYTRQ